MVNCLVALGSNQGQRQQTLLRAVELLRDVAGVDVRSLSPWYESPAIGGEGGQPRFLNGVIVLQTMLAAPELLGVMHDVEVTLGRTRQRRWEARVIDLDLLLYDQQIVYSARDTESQLQIPHPRMSFRPFVLQPAAAVAGDWCHPELKCTLGQLLLRLEEGQDCLLVAGRPAQRAAILERLSRLLPGWRGVQVEGNPNGWLCCSASTSTDEPKLQVLADDSVEPVPETPCLWLSRVPQGQRDVELRAALQCVWPDQVAR